MGSRFLSALGPTRLYPLTDRLISGRSHNEQVSRLSGRGVTVIQLREKLLSVGKFYEEASAALEIARQLGVTIIINDRVDIALALKADGVHLGQDDMPAEAARRLLGPDAVIGVSTHNLEQVQLAADLPVDYVAIGPVFPTSTKESTNPSLGIAGVRRVRHALPDLPLVAIGGITRATYQEVLNAGADAVSIIRDFWVPNSNPNSNH